MSEVDEVKKRIERRKKPLTNAHFNKLYNGMIRMMVLMIVVIGAMIVVNHPEIESQTLKDLLRLPVLDYLDCQSKFYRHIVV